jgi:ribosomal protein L16 Arg81 hydroxylase
MQTLEPDEILGDPAIFFGRYFNREPFLRRSALRADPAQILSIADLDTVINSEAIRLPYLDVAKDGKQVPTAAYTEPVVVQGTYVTDRVVPARIASLFRSGATLTFNSLNHHRANLRVLAASMTAVFAAQSEVIGFLTPATRRGLAPHYDPVDVFVVQLAGSKSWKVWPVPPRRRGDDLGNLNEAELGEPAIAATLEPGDVLYVPYNCAHVATAGDRVSLHLSITVQPRRWAGLLEEVVAHLVRDDPRFWGNPWLRDETTPARLREMLDFLTDRLSTVDTEAEVARLIAEGIERAKGTDAFAALADAAAADAIQPDSMLARDGRVRVDVIGYEGDRVRAAIDGAIYALPNTVVEALSAHPDGATCRAGTLLPNSSSDVSTRTARTLARIGVLRPVSRAPVAALPVAET